MGHLPITETMEACREFIDIHPYSCLCGAGITHHDECGYHVARRKAGLLLARCGFPLQFPPDKEELAKAAQEREKKP